MSTGIAARAESMPELWGTVNEIETMITVIDEKLCNLDMHGASDQCHADVNHLIILTGILSGVADHLARQTSVR